MKYNVLKPIIYDGKEYKIGQEVDILEKSVAESCLERKLVEEIKKGEDTAGEVVSEPQSLENVEDKEDKEATETEIKENGSVADVEDTTKATEEKKKNKENKRGTVKK